MQLCQRVLHIKSKKEELTKLLPSAKLTIGSKEDFNKLHKQVEEGELDGLFRVTEKEWSSRNYVYV